jgi:hypothetical protein
VERPAGERLATVEAELRALREDVEANTAELARTRGRIHTLEATVQGMVTLEKESRRLTIDRQRRLELWLAALSLFVGLAGIVVPATLAVVLTR